MSASGTTRIHTDKLGDHLPNNKWHSGTSLATSRMILR